MINRIKKCLPLAASVAATVFFAAAAVAQSAPPPATAPAANTAKPSPYQGVSKPPADDTITVNDEQPAQAAPAANPTPAPAPSRWLPHHPNWPRRITMMKTDQLRRC